MHCSVVSSEAGTLNSVQCSSVQTKTEQLACFAQTFTMAVELLHRCHLYAACKIKMTAQRVETYRLRGGNIIMRSICNITRGAQSDHSFFQKLAEKGLLKQSYWVNLFHVSLVDRCTGDLIIALKTWKSQIFMICHL